MDDSKLEEKPDPSILTTQQLWREIAGLKELLISRMDAIEKATVIAHEDMVRVPTEVQKQVENLKRLHEEKINCLSELMEEKFKSVGQQIADRDAQRIQTINDNKGAVSAALQAAKESYGEQIKTQAMAIAKNEMAAVKQIESLEDKLNDMKDRLTTIEAMSRGSERTDAARHVTTNFNAYLIVSFIGIVLGIAGIVIAIKK